MMAATTAAAGTMSIASVRGMHPGMARVAVVASGQKQFRSAVEEYLSSSHWHCELAEGGADAIAKIDAAVQGGADAALVLDSVLPDLDADEVADMVERTQPGVEVVMLDRVASARNSDCDSGHDNDKRRGCAALWSAVRYADGAVRLCGQGMGLDNEQKQRKDGFESGDHKVGSPARVNLGFAGMERSQRPEQRYLGQRYSGRPTVTFGTETIPLPLPGMIGNSAAMCRMYRLVRLVARRDTTVLITGETGTGKELVARALHQLSDRADKPFVVVNCSAIPDTLLESELFGYARGSFTGATQARIGRIQVADGGTLFLDEIGELSSPMQAKLLRFLQEGEIQRLGETDSVRVNVRVVAATNVDLARSARERNGGFRQDLFHRLAVFPIELPELRRRESDGLLLARYFLEKYGAADAVLSHGAERILLSYDWPGNVRELQHAVERAVILAEGRSRIEPEDLGLENFGLENPGAENFGPDERGHDSGGLESFGLKINFSGPMKSQPELM